jgi:hypothetical protein
VNLGASDDRLPTPTSPHSQCALSQDLRSPGLLLKKKGDYVRIVVKTK